MFWGGNMKSFSSSPLFIGSTALEFSDDTEAANNNTSFNNDNPHLTQFKQDLLVVSLFTYTA